MATLAHWADWLADLALAVAALYVAGQALRGWYLEGRAEKLPEGPEKQAMINDAKTFYALASLSKVWVLLLVFGGTLTKFLLALGDVPW